MNASRRRSTPGHRMVRAVLVASIAGVLTVATTASAAAAAPAPGSYTGPGFDACTAPSSAAMQAWLASPYRAIGIYIGGINRGCAQPQLTADWVSTQQSAGWHLLPIYMGLQAPCTTSSKPHLLDLANATTQGTAAANDAVANAQALGLAAGTTIFDDMEAYRTDDPSCRTAVLMFQSAWTQRLHDFGYLSGFYSSLASGVADQVAVYNSISYVRPDYLWLARYDGVATVSNPAIPSGYWMPQRRIKQYLGGHDEAWGGVTINIDNDYVDVAPLPPTPFGDFTGNGWSDLISRNVSTGDLWLYPGNGTTTAGRALIGVGWNGMDAITRLGDYTGDGREDVLAREKATGYLWLYPGAGTGLASRRLVGTSWNTMREITPAGDVNRDGHNDLVAVQSATGYLLLYSGDGTSLGNGVKIGTGWNTLDELTGVGDFNRDGNVDLLARHKATGDLYLYRGFTGGFGSPVKIGIGWSIMRDLTGTGDFDRDGFNDLVTIEKTTGNMHRYPGRGTSFGTRVTIGTGWTAYQPLL